MQPALPPGLDELKEDDIRAAVGQLLVVGFEGATRRRPTIASALQEDRIGGVILFRRNVERCRAGRRAQRASPRLRKRRRRGPFVCVDQEGGRVVRVREPLTPIPPMRAVGATGDRRLISEVSEVIATEIGALGFNVNFAPVLDVDTNPNNPVIGDRAFSAIPRGSRPLRGGVLARPPYSGCSALRKALPWPRGHSGGQPQRPADGRTRSRTPRQGRVDCPSSA